MAQIKILSVIFHAVDSSNEDLAHLIENIFQYFQPIHKNIEIRRRLSSKLSLSFQ